MAALILLAFQSDVPPAGYTGFDERLVFAIAGFGLATLMLVFVRRRRRRRQES